MKKALLLIVSVLCVLQANAQVETPTVTIDSLSVKLAKLQHDYDYLSCDYQLYQMKMDLNGLTQDINIKANALTINLYHGRYERALYTAYSENYDAYCSNYEALKRKLESVQNLIVAKVITSNFTDLELDVIKASLGSIDQGMAVVESGLKYYDVVLQAYRDKR